MDHEDGRPHHVAQERATHQAGVYPEDFESLGTGCP